MDGDTTADVLARINRVIAFKPDKIFLQIGINDLFGIYCFSGNEEPRINAGLAEIARGHFTICQTLLREIPGCVLYICSLAPTACDFDLRDRINENIRTLNRMLAKTAEDTGSVYINLYDKLADAGGALGPGYGIDGVHLLPAAYAVWLETLLPYLREGEAAYNTR
jgi:lysophospholipase L1-like esterase